MWGLDGGVGLHATDFPLGPQGGMRQRPPERQGNAATLQIERLAEDEGAGPAVGWRGAWPGAGQGPRTGSGLDRVQLSGFTSSSKSQLHPHSTAPGASLSQARRHDDACLS